MTTQSGTHVTLSVHDGGSPGSYLPVGGFSKVKWQVANQPPRSDTLGGTAWRQLLGGSGSRSLSVSASGMFTASAGESRLFALSLTGGAAPMQLVCEDGKTLTGAFLATRYDREAAQDGEIDASMTLESAGDIVLIG